MKAPYLILLTVIVIMLGVVADLWGAKSELERKIEGLTSGVRGTLTLWNDTGDTLLIGKDEVTVRMDPGEHRSISKAVLGGARKLLFLEQWPDIPTPNEANLRAWAHIPPPTRLTITLRDGLDSSDAGPDTVCLQLAGCLRWAEGYEIQGRREVSRPSAADDALART